MGNAVTLEHLAASLTGAEQDGSDEFLSATYRAYWPELCQYVRRNSAAAALDPEDVAQTAFARFVALKNPRAISNPRAFLYRTAHNIVIDAQRRNRTQDKLAARDAPPGAQEHSTDLTPERVALATERLGVLEAAVESLPQRDAQVLLAHCVHNYSYSEIARRLGMTPAGIRRIVKAALAVCEAAAQAWERKVAEDRS